MKPIASCDIETDPFKQFRTPKPFLAGWFDGSRLRTFWDDTPVKVKYRGKTIETRQCIYDCWRSMRKELRGSYIYWHNGGKFDAREFMPFLAADEFTLKPIKGRMARFVHADGTEFRDSFCLLPVSLKATGEKGEIDYKYFEKNRREKHRAAIMEYFKTDLTVLYSKVQEFVSLYGFGMTMAGRTFDQLKKEFDIHPPKTNEYHDDQFRPFYYGGRVEFFQLGRCPGTYTVIDINSAYPRAMLEKHAFGLEFKSRETLPKSESVIGTCFIRFRGNSSGGLPWRGEDGALSFKEHAGEFCVTGWEFLAAKKAGAVRVESISEVLVPQETRDFSKFVNHFYRQKREAVKGSSEELFAKLFLNSAYGRFALNPRDFRDVIMSDYGEEPEENKADRKKIAALVKARHPGIRGKAFAEKCRDYWAGYTGKWERANDFEDIGVSIWERPAEIKSNSFFNVATAASITGWVRAFLFESLRACRGVAYCDTDSIIAETSGNLALGRDLGEWKIEGVSSPGSLWIAGKKLYALHLAPEWWSGKLEGKPVKWSECTPAQRKRVKWKEWKLASKGVKLSAEEIVRVAEGEAVKSTLAAPTFSLYSTRKVGGSRADFITRTVVRDDLRKRRKAA